MFVQICQTDVLISKQHLKLIVMQQHLGCVRTKFEMKYKEIPLTHALTMVPQHYTTPVFIDSPN